MLYKSISMTIVSRSFSFVKNIQFMYWEFMIIVQTFALDIGGNENFRKWKWKCLVHLHRSTSQISMTELFHKSSWRFFYCETFNSRFKSQLSPFLLCFHSYKSLYVHLFISLNFFSLETKIEILNHKNLRNIRKLSLSRPIFSCTFWKKYVET